MKYCPTCNHTFADTETFCGFDGTKLVGDASHPAIPQSHEVPVGTPLTREAPRVPSAATSSDPVERITCEWCQGMNQKTALSCWACGAPLDIKNLVSESGWREAPRIRAMTEIHFGLSTSQVEGEIVPTAEINLGQG